MLSVDTYILVNALVGFSLFVALHSIGMRQAGEEKVLRWTMRVFIAACIFQILGSILSLQISGLSNQNLDSLCLMLAMIMSFVLFGLLSFHYILWVFGPYESSLRLRLIRELSEVYPKGLTWQEITQRYNRDIILKRRLKRLIHARELISDGEKYRRKRRVSFFILMDAISLWIESLSGFKR